MITRIIVAKPCHAVYRTPSDRTKQSPKGTEKKFFLSNKAQFEGAMVGGEEYFGQQESTVRVFNSIGQLVYLDLSRNDSPW
jgi:hypothetical protein